MQGDDHIIRGKLARALVVLTVVMFPLTALAKLIA